MTQFGLVLNGTWCNHQRNALIGNDPKKLSHAENKTKEQQTRPEREC